MSPRSSSVATADSDATPRMRAISGRETGCRYATIDRHSACACVSGGVRGLAKRRRAGLSAAGVVERVQPPAISRRTRPPWRFWSSARACSTCAGSVSVASARSLTFTGSWERNSNDSTMAASSGGAVSLLVSLIRGSTRDGSGRDRVRCDACGDAARRIAQRVRHRDRYGSERNLLLPYRLPLLVELQQRKQRHGLRQPVASFDGVVEAEAPAPAEQHAQVREALADRDPRARHVADVEAGRRPQQPADRL